MATKQGVRKVETDRVVELDKRIPTNLIIQYGGKDGDYYILKAGLEWKAIQLFGNAGYSLHISPVEMDYENKRFVFKAVLKVLENGAVYTNYGEATSGNVNPTMQKQLLHLAVTRAECRVLRMATACGYASYDEVRTIKENGGSAVVIPGANKPATKEQLATIKALDPDKSIRKNLKGMAHISSIQVKTKQEASEMIGKISGVK